MGPLNYVWYQHQWQRTAANVFDADGGNGLVRFWDCFQASARISSAEVPAATFAPLLRAGIIQAVGRAVQCWR